MVFATKMLPIFQPVGSGSTGGELTRKTSAFDWDVSKLSWQEIKITEPLAKLTGQRALEAGIVNLGMWESIENK